MMCNFPFSQMMQSYGYDAPHAGSVQAPGIEALQEQTPLLLCHQSQYPAQRYVYQALLLP